MNLHLFKFYRTNTINLEAIRRGEVYLAHPSTFNDPFDSIVNAKANDNEILAHISEYIIATDPELEIYYNEDELRVRWGSWKEDDPNNAIAPHFTDSLKYLSTDLPRLAVKYKEHALAADPSRVGQLQRYLRITENLGICSFSKKYDSESMWAYYADNHRGICVEYEIDLTKIRSPFFFDDVIYVDSDEYVDMNTSSDDDIIARASFKKRCWSNELEVRLIHPNKSNSRIAFPGKIKSIIFGAFAPNHEIELIKQIFKKPRPKFYKMQIYYGTKMYSRQLIDDF